MAEVVLKTTFKFRRGNSAEWDRVNPILAEAEPGFELDTGMLKIGNGVTPWRDLLYIGGGDISLSGDGKSIIIDGNIISLWGFEEAQTGQSIRKTAEGALEWYTPTGGGLGLEPKKIDNLDEIDLTDPDASKFLYLLLRPVPNNNDIYDEYIIIDGAIEHIGSTGVDLDAYATNEKVDSIPNTLLSTISPLVAEDGILLRLTDSTRVRDKWGALAPRSVEIPLATSELAGLISGEEKVKLEEIAEGAQVNRLEGIILDGVELEITDKKISLPLATNELAGLIKGDESLNHVMVDEDGLAEVYSLGVDKLENVDGITLVLSAGGAE